MITISGPAPIRRGAIHLSVECLPQKGKEGRAYVLEQLSSDDADSVLVQSCIKAAIRRFSRGRWAAVGFHFNEERGTMFVPIKLVE